MAASSSTGHDARFKKVAPEYRHSRIYSSKQNILFQRAQKASITEIVNYEYFMKFKSLRFVLTNPLVHTEEKIHRRFYETHFLLHPYS